MDDACSAEANACLSGAPYQVDKLRVDRRGDDSPATGRAGSDAAVPPEAHAAAREVAVTAMRVHPRVVAPAFGTGGRIERGDNARGRDHVHRPVHDEWRDLE